MAKHCLHWLSFIKLSVREPRDITYERVRHAQGGSLSRALSITLLLK